MKEGRELDFLVAQRVFGWKHTCDVCPGETCWGWEIDGYDTHRSKDVPFFSTSIAEAFKVRDLIASKTFSIRHFFAQALRQIISEESGDYLLHDSELIFRVQPRHICIAAVTAMITSRPPESS